MLDLAGRVTFGMWCIALMVDMVVCFQQSSLFAWLAWVRATARKALATAWSCVESLRCLPMKGATEDSFIDACMRRQLEAWQVHQALMLSWVIRSIWRVGLCVIVVNLLRRTPRWLSPTQDAICCMWYITAVLGIAYPQLINPRTLKLWYSWFMCLFCVWVLPMSALPGTVPTTMLLFLVPRLMFATLNANLPHFVLWNVGLSILACYTHSLHEGTDQLVLSGNGFVMFEAWNCALIVYISSFMVSTKVMEVRKTVESRAESKELSAMSTWLDTFCEVVVELDEAFCLMEDAPKLAGMLLHGSTRSLQGIPFQQFMASEQAFHVRMRDSLSNDLDLELFHVQFEALDNRPRHLVGVREFTDAPGVPRSHNPPGEVQQSQAARPRIIGAPVAGTPSVAVRSELPPRSVAGTSACSGRSRTSTNVGLVLPRFQATLDSAKQAQLLEAIMQWNFSILQASCCHYHTSLRELKRMVALLEGEPCNPGFQQLDGWQCANCRLLHSDASVMDRQTGLCMSCTKYRQSLHSTRGYSSEASIAENTHRESCSLSL